MNDPAGSLRSADQSPGLRKLFLLPALLLSCSPAGEDALLGRWESATAEGSRFVEFRADGAFGVGDDPDRMTPGRFRFRGKGRVAVQVSSGSSFPGEFEVWQVRVSGDSLSTYREGSFGLAAGSRTFRRSTSPRPNMPSTAGGDSKRQER